MNTDDIHDLAAAYVVDAVDDVEWARFEEHLATCQACLDEVDSLRGAAAELTMTTQTAPPSSLRESVLREISHIRPLSPLGEPPAPEQERPKSAAAESLAPAVPTRLESKRAEKARRTPQLRQWLIGVAAAAVLATGGVVWHPWSSGGNTQQLTALEQVLQAKDAQTFKARVGDATATIVRSPGLKKAVIVTANLPAAPDGKVYELWLQRGSAMVPAGLMPTGTANKVLLEGDAANAQGVGITVEPAGGSDTPTLPPVAVITFA